jgi:superfamily II DNA or RNA helicase
MANLEILRRTASFKWERFFSQDVINDALWKVKASITGVIAAQRSEHEFHVQGTVQLPPEHGRSTFGNRPCTFVSHLIFQGKDGYVTCSCVASRNCVHAFLLIDHIRTKDLADQASALLQWAKVTASRPPEFLDSYRIEVGVRLHILKSKGGTELLRVAPHLLAARTDAGELHEIDPKAWQSATSRLTPEDVSAFATLSLHPMAQPNDRSHQRSALPKIWVIASAGQESALEAILVKGGVKYQGKSVRLGRPLPATAQWLIDAEGNQQLSLLANGEAIARPLIAHSAWYLDEQQLVLGRILCDIELVRNVASAPKLSREKSREVVGAWPVAARVAAPLDTTEIDDVRLEPIPVLRMGAVPSGSATDAADPSSDIPIARISYDYNGTIVEAGGFGQSEVVVRSTPTGIKRIHRNRDVEAQTEEAVTKAGFQRAELSAAPIAPDKLKRGDLALKGRASDVSSFLNAAESLRPSRIQLRMEADYGIRDIPVESEPRAVISETDNFQLFELGLEIDIDGTKYDIEPLIISALSDRAFSLTPLPNEPKDLMWTLRLGEGNLVRIPVARLRNFLTPLMVWFSDVAIGARKGKALSISRLQAALLADELGMARASVLPDIRMAIARVREHATAPLPKTPRGFIGKLRSYQNEGLRWLNALAEGELGGILADEMGLGKTIQLLAHIQHLRNAQKLTEPVLVVMPTSLIFNWRNEAAQFVPGLRVLSLHGAQRAESFDTISSYDIVLTTYTLLHRDIAVLSKHSFSLVVADESQNIKNVLTKWASAIRKINARRFLATTGTPLENSLSDVWAQFDLVLPTLLGDRKSFVTVYKTPIEKGGSVDRQAHLNRRIAPFILRRTKQEVAAELPPKTEIIRSIEMGAAQSDLYTSIRVTMYDRVRQEIATRGIKRSGIIILTALLKMRQVCCHPQLLSEHHNVTLRESAKLDVLMDLVRNLVAEGRRILVFSSFAKMLDLIAEAMVAEGVKYNMLTGKTKDREPLVNSFQQGHVPVFLISLKAGGVGLNLTSADCVVLFDPWFNPAAEDQATDRAHRIGQMKPVFVYKLVCRNTFEERVIEMQQKKANLARAMLDGGTTSTLRFDESDIEALFAGAPTDD